MHLIKENDVYKRESEEVYSLTETITFKLPFTQEYSKHESDWYMIVALEKSDLVKEDRHLLTKELLVEYRWAIREGYNHELDKALTEPYHYPRNRNTIAGIKGYIKRIKELSDQEMEHIRKLRYPDSQ